MALEGSMNLDDNGLCFACGRENPHGLHMAVSYTDDAAQCRITLPPHFQGWSGIAHGGVVSALMDEIMAYAVLHFVGNGVTAVMETRFRKPVPLETELLVEGRIAKNRGRMVTAVACITQDGAARPLAEAQGTFVLPKPE